MDQYELATSDFPESTGDYSDYCRGSTKNRRGYTCTLWRLFHVSIEIQCIEVQERIIEQK